MKNLFYTITVAIFLFSCGNTDSSEYAQEEMSFADYESDNISQVQGGYFAANDDTYNYTSTVVNGSVSSTVSSDNKDYDEAERKVSTTNDGTGTDESSTSKEPAAHNRMLIKEGYVNFETKDIDASRQYINQLVETYGAYISNENQYDYGSEVQEVITVRMPSANFDLFLEGLASNVSRFDSKTINVQDVTEEYVDIQSRLSAKYEIEKTYLELLKKANTVDDILNVERELGYIREEIESMEGRLRYLKDRVGFSTLTMTYYQYGEAVASVGFLSQFWNSLRQGGRDVKFTVLDIASAWPGLIILGLIIFFARRWWKKRKAKKEAMN